MHTPQAPERLIVPSLMFVGDQYGRAAEAIELYTQVFDDSEVGSIQRAPGEEGDDGQGPVMFADFTLRGICLAAMDDDAAHEFQFNEGISLIVNCADQAEVDRYWDALTADGGQAQQCGWLKDTFGVRWQIVPERLTELLWETDPATSERVAEALLEMQKIDVGELEVAAEG
jgi:predicted 3-demethylubiquinone-9 3-methyltransferase (glyoxalase superfamily)